ncbi:MAG: hypothetical protein CMM01_15360 [Rhodopirellula sp.]|nr:hypothetical protein [Rhodopirellula sp.]OUX50495.1 MAG: hypothetical protein CBE43_07370 [Rhodopirellula sp. TMED283]
MRNLRKFLSNSLTPRSHKRRSSARRSRNEYSLGRQLSSESLEKRELLAGDVVDNTSHNYHTPFDVNADYQITVGDALVVLTQLGKLGVEGEAAASNEENRLFPDVNNDGRLSASDALGVINAVGRGEGVGELVEMFLTARDKDDNAIETVNGEYNIPVGEKFFLEVAYSDLRTPIDANGAFQLRADVIASLPDYLVPVMRETQRLRFNPEVYSSENLESVTFTQEGTGLAYVAPAASWQANDNFQVLLAMQEFGYELNTDYVLDPTLQFAGGDRGYLIHWIGDVYDDVDVPNISITIQQNGGAAMEASVTEFAPFLAGADTILGTADDIPNSDAVQFNLDLDVRTWSPFYGSNQKRTFYDSLNTGEFDTQRDDDPSRPGFIKAGGVGANSPTGLAGVDIGWQGATPNDAFSLPVRLVQPVQGLIVNLTPSFDTDSESVLLYGESEPTDASQVVLDSYDGTGSPVDTGVPGVAHVIINAIGENRDPVVSDQIVKSFTQNVNQTAVDLLEFASDPDNNPLSVDASSVIVTGDVSGLLVSGDEAIVDPTEYSFLAESEQEVITISYDIVDGAGGSVAQLATITVTGLNDPATAITGNATGSVTEDGILIANGSLTVADLDAGEDQVQPQTDSSGIYGTFSIDASGSWTYSLNNADSVVQALAAGAAPTDTFSVVSKDGAVSVDVIVTVNGTNDAPTKGAPVTATFSEEQEVTSVDLLTGASDIDQGDVLSVANYAVASGDAVGVVKNGNNVDVDPGAYGTLEDGQSEVIVLDYDISDGNGGSVGQTATITITGVSNFSPVITVEVGDGDTGAVNEQADTTGDEVTVATASGTLSFTDQDPDDTHTVATAATAPGYIGTFSASLTPAVNGLDGEVVWSFSATDAELDELFDGEERQQIYEVTVTDSSNGTDVQQVVITLNGANDQPQVTGPIARIFNSGMPVEDINLVTNAVDVDGDVLRVGDDPVVITGGDASGVSVDQPNNLVTVTPSAYASLDVGEQEVVELSYAIVDDHGGTVAQTATLTFNGINDPPTPGSPISRTFSQNDSVSTVSLITGATDPENDTLTIDQVSFQPVNPIGFQIVNDDSVEVTPAAYVSLNAEEEIDIQINYVIDDGAGNQTPQQTATITITGANDVATINGDDTGDVVEDTAVTNDLLTTSGQLVVSDVDTGQAIFNTSVTGAEGNLGMLFITEAGEWSYTVDNNDPSVQQLAAGSQLTDTFTVESRDGTATKNIVITITGVNDIAVISGSNVGAVTEDDSDSLNTSGNLTITDVDAGEAVFDVTSVVKLGSELGNLTINSEGQWNYTLDNALPAVQELPAGATLVERFEVRSFDQGTTETIVVTVTGVNDVPVFGGVTAGSVNEDAAATLATTGALTILDVDVAESFVQTTVVPTGETLGTLVVQTDGVWTYQADNSQDDIQALVGNQSIVERFTVTSADGSQTQVVTITINGNNDNPEAVDDTRLALKDSDGILIDVLANDNAGAGGLEDPNQTITIAGDSLQLSESATEGVPDGFIAIEDGNIRYVPGEGFEGTATIEYEVFDGELVDSGTVTVTVVDFVPSTLGGSVFVDHVENFRDVRDNGAEPYRDGVQDDDEKGFASIRIKLVSENNYTNSPIEREVLTDVDGNFEFTDIAPGEYKVVYEHSEQIRYDGPVEYVVDIPALGDVQRNDLNYGLIGTQGAAMAGVGLLASSYLRTNATLAQISDGGREGGLVCLDSSGQQSFMVLGSGFENVEFAELELNEANDAALLTLLTEEGQRLSTILTDDFFVVSNDQCGIQFFGSLNDHFFQEAGSTDGTPFDDTRTAVDDFEDNNNDA